MLWLLQPRSEDHPSSRTDETAGTPLSMTVLCVSTSFAHHRIRCFLMTGSRRRAEESEAPEVKERLDPPTLISVASRSAWCASWTRSIPSRSWLMAAPSIIRAMSDMASGGATVEPSSFKLRTGACLPAVGLGTYQIKGEAGYKAVLEALKLGYRHIDTAAGYRNERNVGEAMRDSGLPREEIFVQSKLAPKDQGSGVAYNAVMDSLNELGLDYIDSYLIHWPGKSGVRTEDPVNRELRHESYRDLQKAHQEGKVRAIGVSNFNQRHLEGLLADPSIMMLPAINQVELHPYYQQRDLRTYCKEHGILIQAYSSLGQLDMSLKEDDVVKEVAAAVNKSPAQVLLRWALEHGIPVIPKSTNPARMAENLSVLDFRLPAEAVTALDTLDRGRKFAWDPRDVA